MLVGAVLGPHQREHGQLDVVGLAAEPLQDQVVLVVGEAECPVPAGRRGRGHQAATRCSTWARTDSNSLSPSAEPVSGSTACSGWGISPKTLPSSLQMPAMSSWEPLGLWPGAYRNT